MCQIKKIGLICVAVLLMFSCEDEVSSVNDLIVGDWVVKELLIDNKDSLNNVIKNEYIDFRVNYPMYIEDRYKKIIINSAFFKNISDYKIVKNDTLCFLKLSNSTVDKFNGIYEIELWYIPENNGTQKLILKSNRVMINARRINSNTEGRNMFLTP